MGGRQDAEAQRAGVVGGGGAEKCVLDCAGFQSGDAAGVAAHLQHFQIAVDVQAIFAEQIAEPLVGGGAEARDAGELAGQVGDAFDVGMDDQIRRQPGQRIAQDRQLDAAQPPFDGHRPAAGDLDAAAEQGGDVHGAAVDVEQLAFEAMLGEDAAVLGDPEKGLGGVDRRVGNPQFVGAGGVGRRRNERE